MMRKMLVPGLVLLAAVLLAGCPRGQVRLPQGDEQILQARAGENISIELTANPTTGYQWRRVETTQDDLVRFVSRDFTSSAPGRMGSGGTETWRFTALKPGRAYIDFEYLRPWEGGVPPAQRKTVVVEIVP